MNGRSIITILLVIAALWAVNTVYDKASGYYNQSVNYELEFNKEKANRLVVVDKITKVVTQKLEVAGINDTSYTNALVAVTLSQPANPGMILGQFRLAFPNQNFDEVSSFYHEVNDAISNHRAELQVIEGRMAEVAFKYEQLRTQVPSKWYLYYRPESLHYEPISTSYNKEVNKTGVDDQVKLNR